MMKKIMKTTNFYIIDTYTLVKKKKNNLNPHGIEYNFFILKRLRLPRVFNPVCTVHVRMYIVGKVHNFTLLYYLFIRVKWGLSLS